MKCVVGGLGDCYFSFQFDCCCCEVGCYYQLVVIESECLEVFLLVDWLWQFWEQLIEQWCVVGQFCQQVDKQCDKLLQWFMKCFYGLFFDVVDW